MRISAVVTDLDGTFWGTDMVVHQATLEAVAAIDAAGIPFLVATGRRAQSARMGLRRAGLDDRPGVLMNGALARDRIDGDSFLVEPIGHDDALAVWDAFRRVDLDPLVYVDHPHTDMLHSDRPSAGETYLRTAPGIAQSNDLEAALEVETVIGFGAFGYPKNVLEPIADSINDDGSATALLARSLLEGDHGIMIQGAGIDKQTGIEAWCTRHAIAVDGLAVVGDGSNDRLMLESAAMAIVPHNADPEIVAIATHHIEPNEAGGWSDIPAMLGL
ncbi:MAG: HAD family hydrolase [Acidimicrobiales bacterium]